MLVYGFVIPRFAFGFGVWLLLNRANEVAREEVREAGRLRCCGVVVAGLLAETDAGSGYPAAKPGVGAGYPVPNAAEPPGSGGA